MLKKTSLSAGIVMVLLILGMVVTRPSDESFDEWVSKQHHITCGGEGICRKGEREIMFSSSGFKNALLFSSKEQEFKDPEGDLITIRTLGLFGKFIDMDDGRLWHVLH
ncbi:hypothetical protein U0355_09220 [Salimicrobium sp. PL1-032A]|uniref:hypothetical protein n=1 Tax=Salimicrobium sp. PL1-032A TaxID=3095364 RepID=UPI003261CF7F